MLLEDRESRGSEGWQGGKAEKSQLKASGWIILTLMSRIHQGFGNDRLELGFFYIYFFGNRQLNCIK